MPKWDRFASVMQEWLGHQGLKGVFAANLRLQGWQAACTVGVDVRTKPGFHAFGY